MNSFWHKKKKKHFIHRILKGQQKNRLNLAASDYQMQRSK